MSLYQGVLEDFDLIVPGFESSGDFASLFFVAGTPDFGAVGTELLNIVLPTTGAYVLAVGGEGFGFGDSYAYNLDAELRLCLCLRVFGCWQGRFRVWPRIN